MKLWRVIAVATTVELAAGAATASLAGLGGAWNGWLDALNIFAPVWIAAAILALAGRMLIPKGRTRTAVGLLVAGTFAANAVLLAPGALAGLGRESAPTGAGALRLLTLNVWNYNVDPTRTLDNVLAAKADVVTLQETQGPFGRVAGPLYQAYRARTHCVGRAADLVILSSWPMIARGCFGDAWPAQGPQDIELAWLTVMAPDGRPITIATSHLGWPAPPGQKAAQMEALGDRLRALGAADLILTGDFNAPPWTFAMAAQDRALRPLTRRTGAVATWPALLPRLSIRIPFPILPLDHIYAAPAWRAGPSRRFVRTGSDHYGLLMTLSRPVGPVLATPVGGPRR